MSKTVQEYQAYRLPMVDYKLFLLMLQEDDDDWPELTDGPLVNRQCRDVVFLVIFVMYLGGMVRLTNTKSLLTRGAYALALYFLNGKTISKAMTRSKIPLLNAVYLFVCSTTLKICCIIVRRQLQYVKPSIPIPTFCEK